VNVSDGVMFKHHCQFITASGPFKGRFLSVGQFAGERVPAAPYMFRVVCSGSASNIPILNLANDAKFRMGPRRA
jgi:hypothetical protein